MTISDEYRLIKLTLPVLEVIHYYLQDKSYMPEAGGVMIGRENISNNHLIIDHITTPLPKDKQNRTNFKRKDSGHLEYYHDLYDSNNGVYMYVGEWHTHPERIPNYSWKDLQNWKRIQKEAASCTPFYHLIAGIEAFRIWKHNDVNRTPLLLATIQWNQIKQFFE